MGLINRETFRLEAEEFARTHPEWADMNSEEAFDFWMARVVRSHLPFRLRVWEASRQHYIARLMKIAKKIKSAEVIELLYTAMPYVDDEEDE